MTKQAVMLMLFVVAVETACAMLPVVGVPSRDATLLLAVIVAPLAEELGRLAAKYKDILWTYTIVLIVLEMVAYMVILTESYSVMLALSARAPAAVMHILCAWRLEEYPNEKGFHQALSMHIAFNTMMCLIL